MAPARRLAARGFEPTSRLKFVLGALGEPGASLKKTLFRPQRSGRWQRPGLRRTLKTLERRGARVLSRGACAKNRRGDPGRGGKLSLGDLQAYAPKVRAPLKIDFQGHQVFSMPPPSSGGLVIAQTLGILDNIELPDSPYGSAYVHVLAEAFKHGFADRARYMGDPDFVDVPVKKLLDPAYHAVLAQRVKPHGTDAPHRYGMPLDRPVSAPPDDGGTAHLSVIDREGNAVALTTTVNLWFGSGVVVPDTGIVLNNQMDDFSLAHDVPNGFGLLGSEKNAVVAGKRPLSSMSPTLVVGAHGVRLAVGGAGGPTIISGTLEVLLNVLLWDMDVQAASAAPRQHHQWMPNVLRLEEPRPPDVVDALKSRGHAVKLVDKITMVNVVGRTVENDIVSLWGASEFRSGARRQGSECPPRCVRTVQNDVGAQGIPESENLPHGTHRQPGRDCLPGDPDLSFPGHQNGCRFFRG